MNLLELHAAPPTQAVTLTLSPHVPGFDFHARCAVAWLASLRPSVFAMYADGIHPLTSYGRTRVCGLCQGTVEIPPCPNPPPS